ncbi:hypothetical protein [Photorhabdus khanii]|uniref:Tail fiber protein n=1 Tax=Photorhabdus khanii subsp. guanajuatensis TaxID=2100166 RepID=A0A4R4K528_9GAMM|nr:hypothetical protein [Photorhabdus khanii]TDB62528.1 hypothetical protein C5467_02020 [Photorhabdus khanii subsp. guanajuatensis]
MEKEHNLSTAQSNTENTNPESIGPSSDELKNRFKAGSIPLQTDYSDLIDIADIGRRAMGKAPDQTDNPNSALELDNSSGLKVKTHPTGSLKADKDGLSVKLKDKSLLTDANGLAVNSGRGLWLNNDKLEVNNRDGIEIVDEGVKVKAGNGINVDSNGVAVKAKDKTINVDPTGISVRLGWGIKIGDGLDVKAGNGITADWNGVSVKSKDNTISVDPTGISVNLGWGVKVGGGLDVKASNGINVDSNGVSVKAKAGSGIKVDSDGVSIDIQSIVSALSDLIIPPGTIVPFYSDGGLPNGWVWCDGNNGTPDLNNTSSNLNLVSGWNQISESFTYLSTGDHPRIHAAHARFIMKK